MSSHMEASKRDAVCLEHSLTNACPCMRKQATGISSAWSGVVQAGRLVLARGSKQTRRRAHRVESRIGLLSHEEATKRDFVYTE